MRTASWILVVMIASACGDSKAKVVDGPSPDVAVDSAPSPVERGRYIMNNLGVCTFCHTPLNPDGSRDLTRLFAGVECLFDVDPTPGVGCVNSRNLTNDPTGLMNATDAQIKMAFQGGIRTDGMPLVPIMPYAIFHNMTDDDANAIVAYLRTVPGVNHTVPPNEEPWLDWNNGTNPPAAFFDPANIPAAPTTGPNAASAQNGRYLSSMAGLCIDCHTPVDPSDPSMITLDHTAYFTGGRVFTADQLGLPVPPYPMMINSRNLTSDQTTGIGTYTMKQIEDAITLGKDPQGDAVCAATHGSGISPYAGLTPSDLDDITNYLMSLPAVVHDTSPNCQGPMVP